MPLPVFKLQKSKLQTPKFWPLGFGHWKLKKGFTLIELLVVISIIAILMAVATVSYLNAQQKGRDNKRKTDLKAVQQALEIYFNQNGKYPTTEATTPLGRIKCNTGDSTMANGDITSISWGSPFACDPDGTVGSKSPITYMNPLPKDPAFSQTSGSQGYYYDNTSASTYILSARLENTKDLDWKGNPITNTTCSPADWTVSDLARNYCVVNP